MKNVSAIALMACGTVLGASEVRAADIIYDEPASAIVAPAPVGSNWYIRGDIGYNFKTKTDGDWDFWNQQGGEYRGIDDTLKYDEFNLKGGASYGVGVGYRFNDMFRTDATLDFFRAGINGKTNCTSYVKSHEHGLNPTLDNCHYEDSSTANVWTAMANAYVDLPKVGVVTPYIGAGLGAAYVKYNTWDTREVCVDCTYTAPKDGLDSWRLAMGLMAGVSYDLTNQLKLDLGYRYLRINGGRAYGYDANDRRTETDEGVGIGASGTQARDNGFNVHTVRAGLRYEFK